MVGTTAVALPESLDARSRAIRLERICKSYGPKLANNLIDLEVSPNTVHAVIGQNGAGKTTLMKIIAGLTPPTSGRIVVDDVPRAFRSSADALALGIGMLHQSILLIETFSVAENVALGTQARKWSRVHRNALNAGVQVLIDQLGLPFDASDGVIGLAADNRQYIALLRLLYRGCSTLILDEPTAVLGPKQIETLLDLLDALRRDGHSIVIVTHKLSEVVRVADKVSVLRDGGVVAEEADRPFDVSRLSRAMFGTDLEDGTAGRTVRRAFDTKRCELIGVDAEGDRGRQALSDISLDIHDGEVVGVAGVEGNGERELGEVLAGLRTVGSGRIVIGGEDVTNRGPRRFRAEGVGVITEQRLRWDLVPDLSIAANLALARPTSGKLSRFRRLLVDWKGVRRRAEQLIETYSISCSGPGAKVAALSGGNQQRVVIAREFSLNPRLLVASQPTIGLDAASASFVHRELRKLGDSGAGVVLISHDLDELLSISDRIVVLYRGRIALDRAVQDITRAAIADAMAGIPSESPANGVAAPGEGAA